MKVSFFGAAKEVTGSCYQLEVNGGKIVIDCGLQQGQDEKDNQKLPFDPRDIDAVLLTHAHIDHSGRIPLLVKDGFKGKIYTTRLTCELIAIMLRDSAHIQEMDAEWENKKGERAGRDLAVPLYTMQDVEDTIQCLVPYDYGIDFSPLDGVTVRFTDAGHLLGSASIQLWLTEAGTTRKIVFSGDIGNIGQPIIRDPQYIKEADFVVMESTYGDRDHEHSGDYVLDLAKIIDETLAGGGNVIIPSFAVGRTQELLYFIREIKEKNLVKSIPDFPVYVDSPLAELATKIYDGDLRGYADEEAIAVINRGFKPIEFPNLFVTESTEESKALNEDRIPKIIISSSGMCNAGRIRHHLKHNLWRKECSIVFVGYQANGTLGRMILEGLEKVKLFGEEIAVAAKIVNFRGLSAHADRTGLLKWIHSYSPKPQKVFIIHGEASVCGIFADTLKSEGYDAFAPNFQMTYDLIGNTVVDEGIQLAVPEHEPTRVQATPLRTINNEAKRGKIVSRNYIRLLEASEMLLATIKRNQSLSNRDVSKITDQIRSLTDKLDR